MLALIVLLALTPGWTVAALLAVGGMQLVYWLVTHPVNSAWLEGETLQGGAAGFFAFGRGDVTADWTDLRDRWEYSHVARAVLGLVGFLCLAIAVTAKPPPG